MASPLPPGTRLGGQYELIRPLGAGGIGQVLLAQDTLLERPVAVKLLHATTLSRPDARARFEREARVLSRLFHPNLVVVLGFGAAEVEGAALPYMVMEYVRGETLAERLQRSGPLPVATALGILRQISGAVAHAHEEGVVHRDLKPSNVLLTRAAGHADFVKLLDFGLARLAQPTVAGQSGDAVTQDHRPLGTPRYMSPEQIRGLPLDARSDQYALAVMAVEMLCGDAPFEGTTAADFMAAHLTQPPRLPAASRPELGLPGAVDAVLARALSKSATERFDEVTQFQAALESALAASHPTAGGSGTADDASRARAVLCLLAEVPARTQDVERWAARLQEVIRAGGAEPVAVIGGRAFGVFPAVGDADQRLETGIAGALATLRALGAAGTGAGRFGVGLTIGTVYHRRGASPVLAGEALARAERLAEPMDAALRVPSSLGRTLGGRYDLEFRGDAARVLGRAQRGALQPTTVLGRVTPFVGRPSALTGLEAAYADTLASGRGGLWQVLGPAGVGKTRLVVEWLATLGHAPGPPPRVATGAARLGPDADIYGPYPDLLRALAKVAPDDPPEVAAVKVQILVRRSAFELTRAPTPAEVDTESAVLRLLGLENAQNTEDPATPSHSPGAVEPGGRTTLFVALSTLFVALARRRPLVLVVDDADALSPAALGLSSHLSGRLAETPAMLVLIARTRPALPPTEAPVTELPVTPLDAPDAGALVDHLLGRLPHVPRRLAAWFGVHGAGLPGPIEALAADLVESGALTPGDGEWTLDDARPLPDVPQALEARASARLERCDEPEREALAAMALAGPRTWRPVVAAIVGDAAANDLPATLERLQGRELIRTSPDSAAFGGAGLRLAEPALGALALATWPAERRRIAHRRCAEVLDTAPRGLEGRDALLAHHWAEAGETLLAATHRLRAATQAIRTHAHEQAAALLEVSLPCVGPAERLGVTVDLAEQCLLAGRMQRAVEVAENAPSGDLAGAPTALRLRLSLCHARALERLGRYAEAQAVCRAARTWFTPGPGTQALEVLLVAAEAGVARKLGEPTRAVALLASLLAAPASDTDPEYEAALGVACRVSGNANLQLRDFEAAEHAFVRAESTATLLRNPVAVLDARIGLGALAWYRGQPEAAITAWRAALSAAEEAGLLQQKAILLNNLGEVEMSLLGPAGALPTLERAVALQAALRSDEGLADGHRLVAECLAATGRSAEAAHHAQLGLAAAERTGAPYFIGVAHRAMARVLRAQGATAAAVDAHRRAALDAFEAGGLGGEVSSLDA